MTEQFQRNIDKSVELERLFDFFSKTRSVFGGLTFNILVISQLISPYTSTRYIGIWIALTFVCYIPRIIVTRQFFKAKANNLVTGDNAAKWEQTVYRNSFLPFLAFSSIAFMPFNGDIHSGFIVACVALLALLVGGVIIYSSSQKVVTLYLYISLGCLISRCLYEGGYYFYLLAFYFFVMLLIVHGLIKAQFENFVERIENRIKFERDSLTDPLTQLPNRRRMELFIETLMPLSKRTGNPFQLAMIDIDHFKQFNDTHGHVKGDKLLIELAKLVRTHIRSSDLFTRYGGEEFALILTTDNPVSAKEFIENLMREIESTLEVTISVGLACSDKAKEFEGLIDLADKELYKAKQQGRNRVCVA